MNEDFYITLIYKRLTKSISDAERAKLEVWLDASEENRLTDRSVTLAWNQSKTLNSNPEVDLEEAFSALELQIENDKAETKQHIQRPKEAKKRRLNRKWLSYAAGIALVLATGLIWSIYTGGTESMLVYAELSTEEILLPDGTKINLNKGSKLKYPENFSGQERRVELEGEAFFDVAHNPQKPFIVETTTGTVKVLGTSFNVRAFPNEAEDWVQVLSGRVQFETTSTQERTILIPGNKAILNKKNKTLKKIDKASPNDIYWYNQKLVFEDVPISQVIESIEKIYGVKIDLENRSLNNCNFSSTFKGPTFETMAATIAGVLGGYLIKNNNNSYLLKGGQCE